MSYAETQAESEKQRDRFVSGYRKSYLKAPETLLNDWDRMLVCTQFLCVYTLRQPRLFTNN